MLGGFSVPLGVPRLPLGGRGLIIAASFLATILHAVPAEARPLQIAAVGGAAETDEDGKVECPGCGGRGKTTCTECGGRGEIYRACPTCRGTGKKPCPVCTKPRDGASSQPGSVPCGYCGGNGTLGNTGRTCSRCEGGGVLRCSTCSGSGTVSCKEEEFVRVCPRCRFVGKLTCTVCGGEGRVDPAVAASRAASPPSAARKTRDEQDRAGKDSSTEAPTGVGGDPATDEEPSLAELRARYERLVPHCESHYDVFVEDLTPGVENIRAAARAMSRRLELAGAPDESESRHQIEQLIERTESFRKRWVELRGLFDEERRSYSNAKRNWELREAAVARTRGVTRTRTEEQWNRRLDIVVRILEKNSAPLIEEDPTWLAREVADLERTWSRLEKSAGEDVTALLAARKDPGEDPAESTPAEAVATDAGSPKESGSRAKPPGSPKGVRPGSSPAGAGPDEPRKTVGERPFPPDPRPKPELRRLTTPDRARSGSRKADETRAGDSPRDSGSGGALWGLIGFLAASVLFVVGSRVRRHLSSPEPEEIRSRDEW